MTAEEIQVIELAGQGAAVEEISEQLGLEQTAVKFCLARHGMLKEDEISDDDFDAIREGLVQLAKYSDNEFVRARVGMFLYERKKGPTASLKGAPAVNIANLNVLIATSHRKILDALNPNRGDGRRDPPAVEALPQPPNSVPETGEHKAIAAAD